MIYGYEYDFSVPAFGEGLAVGAAGVALAILLIFLLVMLAISIVSYVLGSVGFYRIAKRRGIHHAWLAWVPVGNGWLLGSISDHYQYVAKHKTTKRRRVLLVLQLIACLFSFLYGFAAAMLGIFEAEGDVGMVALIMISYLVVMGLSIAATVFCYIAYYDLFRSCRPGSAVLFLILGIFFNFTLPFFVFACSGSDLGMPARRVTRPAPQIPCQPEDVPEQEEIPVVETEVLDETTDE